MDVKQLLRENETKDLLRFVTAGSVDDGKSTLIGRLLFESKGIYEDQLSSIKRISARTGSAGGDLDLALVTDGLKAEREQGITIDVAYRYFSTPKRKFIIADTPGHEQYTRNMATGASTASLIIVLIDAANGVLTQSKRHAFIAALLGIPHVMVAVNKMDLVDYNQKAFEDIRKEFTEFAAKLEITDLTFIPVSALKGDNIVKKSNKMPWYQGGTLLNHLETIHIASDRNLIDLRFPVQYVLRPDHTFRGYLGTLASGTISKGQEVMILPSRLTTKVKTLFDPDGNELNEAFPPLSIGVTLEDEIDISRGDMLVHVNNVPKFGRQFEAMIVWMAADEMVCEKQYLIKHTTTTTQGTISDLRFKVDVNTLHRNRTDKLGLNEIGRCQLTLNRPISFDPYNRNRTTGSFIIIDRLTNNTVGAGMILDRETNELLEDIKTITAPQSRNIKEHKSGITTQQRAEKFNQKPVTIWFTGLPGSGKSTISYELEKRLFENGYNAFVLDGENLRMGISSDLAFSADDRLENLRRAAEIAKLMNSAGLITICGFVTPYKTTREQAKRILGDNCIEIYLSAPIDVCRQRKTELYQKADSGEIELFSGVTAPFEKPKKTDLELATHESSIDECVKKILNLLKEKGVIG